MAINSIQPITNFDRTLGNFAMTPWKLHMLTLKTIKGPRHQIMELEDVKIQTVQILQLIRFIATIAILSELG